MRETTGFSIRKYRVLPEDLERISVLSVIGLCSWKILERLYMPLKMETDISGDVVILYCAGRLVFGDETAAFRERIKNILLGAKQIVVNLSGIEYIDSGGLGTLVGMLASTRNRHGEIKLVSPNQRVADLLRRTRLNTVFKSYKSDDEAVRAFRTNS